MEIKRIVHTYDTFKLDIGRIDLKQNRIIGLVGENGSGKTTLMNILSGFRKANGECTLANHQNEQILYIPSDLNVYGYLTVSEFVELIINYSESDLDAATLLSKLNLEASSNTLIENLSQGMQKKLTLINLFTNKYDILLLDEPFNSIDMTYVYHLKKELKELSKNRTILISSHILDTLNDLCTEFIYLKAGRVYKQFKNEGNHILEREIFE